VIGISVKGVGQRNETGSWMFTINSLCLKGDPTERATLLPYAKNAIKNSQGIGIYISGHIHRRKM